ncbi:DinB family protein [Streptomyces sp. NPDC051554]|uniref:DinB family protein n=1 Tax=Streptomyces sp. NPDC051554 TaxID=3365656 RepID=UPI0037AB2A97
MADTIVPAPVTRDVLAIFENVRFRLFERLEGLTDAEYHWEPVSDCISIRPGDDDVFRVATLFPESSPDSPDPFTTIAWRIWHIDSLCLRGSVIHFFEDVPALGDRHESGRAPRKRASRRWPRTGSTSFPVSQPSVTSASWCQ